ncbi:MAG: hypothetical protein KDA37_00530, partial [Planctomycetales bacterium]|nr:hypothetical protein [Planctomycetales bacterium]
EHAAAIDQLEASLNEHHGSHGGILPPTANGPLDAYVSFLEARGLYAAGEQTLHAELAHAFNDAQRLWLRLRLYRLYRGALANEGTVSLGTGAELFHAVQRDLQQELDTPDHNHRHALVDEMCNIYATASEKKLPGYEQDLKTFAYKRMPEVLKIQTSNFQNMVQRVADTLRSILGPGEGLRFLITCLENEPTWYRYSNQDGWRQFGWQVANWRKEAQDAGQFHGDIEPRLIAIVLRELRADLETRSSTNRCLYHRDYHGSYYWESKEALFEREAEEVYRERKHSGVAVKYLADYLHHGTHSYRRAIAMLFVADRDGLLDEQGRATLVRYLHEQNRYGESIALLTDLMELRPENLEYRTRLMHAYFRTDRGEELRAVLTDTDKFFHQANRWGEGPLAALAASCLENQLYKESAAYCEELIPLHQRTQPNRGVGNGALSGYYANLARAYAGLGDTAKAVDAACGAIVSWGTNEPSRRYAIDALHDILAQSEDLDGYVVELDRQVEETGLDNPIVRKQLGRVYSEKAQYGHAIEQLKLARNAQPNDAETPRLLVECCDKREDRRGAITQLLYSIGLSPRNIDLYQDLARRFRDAGEPEQAERAVTSIVEALPSESESHAALAKVRQQQDRWDDAIEHWRRVSELRRLEPTGLLKLAAAQLHQQQWAPARETLNTLRSQQWPARFPNVEQEVRELERQWEQGQ